MFSMTHPLRSMDDTILADIVEDFHRIKGLKDVVVLETLHRGALLVKKPDLSRDYNGTEKERKELASENAGRLSSMTKALRVLLFTCAIGAVVQ